MRVLEADLTVFSSVVVYVTDEQWEAYDHNEHDILEDAYASGELGIPEGHEWNGVGSRDA